MSSEVSFKYAHIIYSYSHLFFASLILSKMAWYYSSYLSRRNSLLLINFTRKSTNIFSMKDLPPTSSSKLSGNRRFLLSWNNYSFASISFTLIFSKLYLSNYSIRSIAEMGSFIDWMTIFYSFGNALPPSI